MGYMPSITTAVDAADRTAARVITVPSFTSAIVIVIHFLRSGRRSSRPQSRQTSGSYNKVARDGPTVKSLASPLAW